jgi:hypothetical protein
MNDDEYENHRLKAEVDYLKQERESEKRSMQVMWFLAIWYLPLFDMWLVKLVQSDNSPTTSGPNLNLVGGIWFVGVPLVTFLYRKFMR